MSVQRRRPGPASLKLPPPSRGRDGAPQPAQVIITRSTDEFITRLPPRSYTPWMNTLTAAGTNVTAAPVGGFHRETIQEKRRGIAYLVMWMEYVWLDSGLDPLDPDALTRFQGAQDLYGRMPFNLVVGGISPYTATARVYDPGPGAQRNVSGFLDLNVNLLSTGNHPTVIYIPENNEMVAQFSNLQAPGHVPTAVGVILRGYAIPQIEMNRVLEETRT